MSEWEAELEEIHRLHCSHPVTSQNEVKKLAELIIKVQHETRKRERKIIIELVEDIGASHTAQDFKNIVLTHIHALNRKMKI